MNKIKYIFCINPGRAGSGYLQKLFSIGEEVNSNHESEPICNGSAMVSFLRDNNDTELRELVDGKICKIKDSLSIGNSIYFESNHCFIKGFGWLLPEFLPQEEVGVVILKRDPKLIAQSLRRIGCNSINYDGKGWLIQGYYKKNIIKYPFGNLTSRFLYYFYHSLYKIHFAIMKRKRIKRTLQVLTFNLIDFSNPFTPPLWFDIPMLEWYAKEVYEQGKKFLDRFSKIKYYEIHIDKLNDFYEVERLYNFFNITISSNQKLKSILGVRVNQKNELG